MSGGWDEWWEGAWSTGVIYELRDEVSERRTELGKVMEDEPLKLSTSIITTNTATHNSQGPYWFYVSR